MQGHYAIPAIVRYYRRPPTRLERDTSPFGGLRVDMGAKAEFDMRRWKEPPHIALANLRPDDLGALTVFTRRYGVINFQGQCIAEGTGRVASADTGRFRDYLRKAWAGDIAAIEQMNVDLKAWVGVTRAELDIVVEDLWTLTRLLFLRDFSTGRTNVCASPDCPAPYFLAVRKGQKFCSQRCAVLVNVRRFREREAEAQSLIRKVREGNRRKHAKEA